MDRREEVEATVVLRIRGTLNRMCLNQAHWNLATNQLKNAQRDDNIKNHGHLYFGVQWCGDPDREHEKVNTFEDGDVVIADGVWFCISNVNTVFGHLWTSGLGQYCEYWNLKRNSVDQICKFPV